MVVNRWRSTESFALFTGKGAKMLGGMEERRKGEVGRGEMMQWAKRKRETKVTQLTWYDFWSLLSKVNTSIASDQWCIYVSTNCIESTKIVEAGCDSSVSWVQLLSFWLTDIAVHRSTMHSLISNTDGAWVKTEIANSWGFFNTLVVAWHVTNDTLQLLI